MERIFLINFISLVFFFTTQISHAKPITPSTFHQFLNATNQWRTNHPATNLIDDDMKLSTPFLIAGMLTFAAAAISSAGGTGGGGLFIPILTIVAGLDLKLASGFSAFMVTGGSIANVVCAMLAKKNGVGMIDFDTALIFQPCMLLGVSVGVVCNRVLPEWVITVFFAVFLGFSTFKTLKSGVRYWKMESERLGRRNGVGNGGVKMEKGEEPLLSDQEKSLADHDEAKITRGDIDNIPWMKLGMLVVIWFSFTVVYLLRGNKYGQGIIQMKACGALYWLISCIQIPLAIIFTTWLLYFAQRVENQQENGGEKTREVCSKLMLPLMGLLAGTLGGVFGVGGGMLISPLLLQIGKKPEVTAATCSFMVFFSSTMSAVQYLLLGMENIAGALTYSCICFVASLVGLTIVQRAIMKHGRASLIVFSVGTVMALSTVLITSFGAVDVWVDYTSGKSMGLKQPC